MKSTLSLLISILLLVLMAFVMASTNTLEALY